MNNNKLLFKLEIFEGPLDLLLHLIEKNKLNIYDIPIAKITDQYIEYINKMEEFDLEISSEFLIMASTLLYIKSKMLLPKKEEDEEDDPRQELVDKLIEYKKYKKISELFSERAQKHMGMFFKDPDGIINQIETTYELPNLSTEKLINAFNRLIVKKERQAPPPKESFSKLIKKVNVSIEEKTEEIICLLNRVYKIRFIDLFRDEKTKIEMIVKFIALLDLIKIGIAEVTYNDSSDKLFIALCTRTNVDRG